MRIKKTTLVIVSILFNLSLFSCDCIKTTNKFIDNLNYDIIVHVRVIEHIPYKVEYNNEIINFEGLTKLVVLKSFKNNLKNDTIFHLNYNPAYCGTSISDLKIGQEAFIKGNHSGRLTVSDFRNIDPTKNKPTKTDLKFEALMQKNISIISALCDYGVVLVNNKKVNDEITIDNEKKSMPIKKLYCILKRSIKKGN